MIITHYGAEHVKVQFGDTVLAFNPVSKNSKLKSTNFGADIALITLNDPDMNGAENASRGDKQAFVINGPGEYEVQGIFVRGFQSQSFYGGTERINTIYTVTLEEMNICFLGALGSSELASEVKEQLDDIDILFVPIGGDGVLNALEAHKLAVKLEPKIIIPIHHEGVGEKSALKTFIEEEGGKGVKPLDKLTVKAKDLKELQGSIVVLSGE